MRLRQEFMVKFVMKPHDKNVSTSNAGYVRRLLCMYKDRLVPKYYCYK